MLLIVTGPNGSGKSLLAMHRLLEEIRTSHRAIVTTLAVDHAALRAYCASKGYGAACDERVMVIDEDELGVFWRHRGCGGDGDGRFPMRPRVLGPFGGPDWSTDRGGGVLYILDEVQVQFSSRAWAKRQKGDGEGLSRGEEWLAYQTQHRKLGDDVYAVTPAASLIDAQFCAQAGGCLTLQNWYRTRLRGIKLPPRIRWQLYQHAPPGASEVVLESGSVFIDGEGLAGCYHTAGGVGLAPQGEADKGVTVKGLPWWTVIVGILGAALVAWFVVSRAMNYAARHGAGVLHGQFQAGVDLGASALGGTNAQQARQRGSSDPSSAVPAPAADPSGGLPAVLGVSWLSSSVRTAGVCLVQFEGAGIVEAQSVHAASNGFLVDGVWHRRASAAVGPEPAKTSGRNSSSGRPRD